jgi:TonB-linked SusC/RagA family outer membrane protein
MFIMKRWLTAVAVLALVLGPTRLHAQMALGRISGVVTATTGEPIAAAQVVVLGTSLGAITNEQGRYSIASVPQGQHRVRASRIGYQPMVVDSVPSSPDQTTPLDFKLTRSAVQLEGVVVVGYGTQQRRDVTGAVASISAQEIRQNPTTNAIEAIKGKVPGVDVVSTGYKPGDGVRVRVRGTRSIKASNDPLYVLDGVPMAGGIGDLSPSDIESIEVLKDASATAIYGSRGANGVVLVTTRRGSAGRTRITYDTYTAAEQPSKKIRVFNGPEFAEYKREAYRTSGDYQRSCPDGNPCDAGDKLTFYAEEYAALKAGISTDWINMISRTGAQLSHQLAVAGGNDRTQYALSGNMVRDEGTILGQDYDRKTMRVNFETQANSRIRFGASALVLASTQDLGRGDAEYGEALANVPLAAAFDSTGAPLFKPTPDPQRVNPRVEIDHFFDQRQRTRAFGTLFATANLAEGLDYRINFGPDRTYQRRGLFHGAQTQANLGTGADGAIWNDRTFDYTLDNLVTYKKSIGADHHIDATFLYSIEKQTTESDSSKASGLPYESQIYWNLGSGSTVEYIGSQISQWALQSYMGRVNYSLMDRYLLTLTTRVDGSSRLAPGKKYSVFPSVALGWRILDAGQFGQGFGPLDNLKFRTSYGRTGNTSVEPYQTQGGLTRSIYSWGTAPGFGYRPGALPNPDLRWEKTSQYDAGLDFGLFHDRLTGTLDGYLAWTNDLIMDRKLPTSTGYTQITQNIGETFNKGLELSLSLITLDGWHGLRWTNDIAASMAHNEIVSLTYGKVSDPGNHWFIGQPIDGGGNSVYYDYRFLGIWQTADSAEARRYGQVPGQIRVQDVNNDGKINASDLQILGNSYPKFVGNWNTRFDWKRLDLSVQTITRQGFMVNNQFRTDNSTLAGRYNTIKVNYWTPTNPSNTDPRPNKNQESPLYGGTRGYEDGSFVRVRNVTVGFTVPPRLTGRLSAESLRIYGTAQNPKTWTSSTVLDPEGRTSAGTPSPKMFLLGANVAF